MVFVLRDVVEGRPRGYIIRDKWRQFLLFLFYRGVKTEDLIVIFALSPIWAVLLLDFNSFALGWNEGRGGILFAVFFLLVEWLDSRKSIETKMSKKRAVVWTLSVLGLVTYFLLVYFLKLQDIIAWIGKGYGISKEGTLSWTWLWEYVVFAGFLTVNLGAIFGAKAVKQNITPIVYCLGTVVVLFLDATFPYQSLGALAATVPFIVVSIVFLLGISGVHVAKSPFATAKAPWVYTEGNLLFMNGRHKGLIVLEINWPCAGILSMLIYMLVVIILMIKLKASLKRKAIYAAVGALGTYFINILRIFLITLAVAYSNIDLRVFHETIGEVLFVIWIMAYLVTAVGVENAMSRREQASLAKYHLMR